MTSRRTRRIRARRDRALIKAGKSYKKELAHDNRPLRRSLMAGLLGSPQLDRGFFGARARPIPEMELTKLIKKVESLINDICLGDPKPILIEENTLKIRKELGKILKIVKPLAEEKRKQEKIQTEIKSLSENKDYKWSSKKRQFIKNKKKVKRK